MLDTNKIKKDFPVIVNNPGIVYLDSGASSLKPKVVIDAMSDYYSNYGVNIHRGVYNISMKATNEYEDSRQVIADFLNCTFDEVVFTRGASASLNLVASSYGTAVLKTDDEIIVSQLEHHSSLLPWQQLANKTGAKLVYVKLDDDGRITVDNFKKVLSEKTKIVSLTFVSNVLGYITPVKEITKLAHEVGAIVSIDGAQSAPHLKVDVKDLDIDFYSISAHKMCGPTGIGVLYGKKELLDFMDPIEFGGDMNDEVNLYDAKFKEVPYKFETGTMPIAEVIGFKEAVKYLTNIGFENIHKHEVELATYAMEELKKLEGVTIYNKSCDTGVLAFNIDKVHSHDSVTGLAENNVCLRAGHHCAELAAKWLNIPASLRVTFYIYNDKKDVDEFIKTVIATRDFFKEFMF